MRNKRPAALTEVATNAKTRLQDFKLVLLAVEEAIARGVVAEEKVISWSLNFGRHFKMTRARATKTLDLKLRDLLSR